MQFSFRRFAVLAIFLLPAFAPAAEHAPGALVAERLRCEYRVQPLGVDQPKPELTWIVTSKENGQRQSAYRVLVASSKELLNSGRGDLWDSGKVDSDATFGIAYSGTELVSHQECYWKVKVWDRDGQEGGWSEPAYWTMGLLDPSEWPGEWIGYDAHRHLNADPPAAPLHGARWICLPDDAGPKAPAESRVFLGVWDLPEDLKPVSARLTVCADDRSLVLINGAQVARTIDTFQPITEEVAAYMRPGRNTVRVMVRNTSEGQTGVCLKLEVKSSGGQDFVLVTDDRWFALPAGEQPWEIRSFDGARNAHVVGPYGVKPWGLPPVRRDLSAPPSYLRGEFTVRAPVKRATAYVAALGWADLSLNGKLVNNDYFSSGWTDYQKRVYYRAYDVTDMLRQGENVWGALLADGWYSGHIGWSTKRDVYGKQPRVRGMLRVEYQDGKAETFATDGDWTVTKGPTKLADILVGEEYDATAEVAAWNQPGGSPERIAKVDVGAEVQPAVQWHPGPPVVAVGEFPAKSVTEPHPGVYVFDIGQNIAGVIKLKIRGERGRRVQIRYAERLNPDGTLYTHNLRLARATDFYTCKSSEEESWQPRQTFHGFQYVELTGLDEPPTVAAVTGVALSSDTPLASQFECSDPNLERLYENVLWTQRANFIDVPTDCPQRDERLGWTGDAQVYVHTACRVADVQTFFRKWLVDLEDAQRGDGQFPKVAPVVHGEEDGGPAWADAGVICPWEVYQAYGDRSLLEQQYPSMVRFVEFCRARSKDEVLPPDRFHAFGDWLSVNASTPNEVIYMAYYARSVDLVRRTAEELGKHDEAQQYAALFNRIKQAFNEHYVDDEGRVQGDTQCGYVLAIVCGLVDGERREIAARRLVDDIRSRGWKLSTGFVGTKDLMLALSEIDRQDVALRLLHQTEYPGWLFSISHGATSIWERWDGWTPERGFQDPGMNSFAHYSFGAVYGWMVECLGGIHSKSPGFGELVIAPTFDPALQQCRIFYDSIRGPIETEWTVTPAGRRYKVTVPANATAQLRLRGTDAEQVKIEGDGDSSSIPSNEVAADGSTTAVLPLPSGEHTLLLPN